jgi:hypothetical protein
MANKKITVVGDGAEEPMTPEEEQRLEVRVDKMLDPNIPDAEPVNLAEEPKPAAKKIAVTLHDDDAPAEPAKNEVKQELVVEPIPEPKVEAPKPHKPVAKKISVTLHDDEEDEKPKKAAKPKAETKKPAKKLKVAIADGSETDDLESKADAIAASALVAEEQLAADKPVEALASEEPQAEAEPEQALAEETSSDSDQGAPPLILKHGTAPIGAPVEESEPEAQEEAPAKAAVAKKISVFHDEVEEAAEPGTVEESAEAEEPIEITVEEIPEPAEEIDVEVDPEQPEPIEEAGSASKAAQAADDKKYHGPEGPIQFKRAEVPIQPRKPGEPRLDQAPAELSEDEAIAQAFETKTGEKSQVLQKTGAALIRVIKWLVILAIVGAIIAVGAIPSLRDKAKKLVGLDSTKAATSQQATPTKAATSQQPAGLEVYLARRAGVYNVYKMDVTAKQEQLVLAGTGNESSTLALTTNSSSTVAALVSTRDGKANADGDFQQSVTLIKLSDGTTTISDTANHIKLVDWLGDTLVYVTSSDSTSTSDANRYQIIAYNTATKVRTVLDHTNYLNDILAAKGSIYYATATSSSTSGQFVKIQPDGKNKTVILPAEIASIVRTNYSNLLLSGVNKWYSYELGGMQATQTNNVSQDGRQYADSSDGKLSAYINSDKQLVVYDVATNKETILVTGGASYPIRWLGSNIIYRSAGSDFTMPSTGGTATKLTDVYDAPGISLWHEQ